MMSAYADCDGGAGSIRIVFFRRAASVLRRARRTALRAHWKLRMTSPPPLQARDKDDARSTSFDKRACVRMA